MPTSFRFARKPLVAALAATVGSTAAPFASAQEDSSPMIEEVMVTARKRTESVMDIPSSVQALSGDALREQNLRNVAEIARFVPELTTRDQGAGITNIVFRGAATDVSYITQSTSSVYLDEISLTTQGQQPYVYAADFSRVEALAGPQGTLYGADAQAGTLRMITNQPVMNEFELVLDGAVRDNNVGESSYDGIVTVNVPLIDDKLALRVVGYSSKDGGFVDNVLGSTPEGDRVMEDFYGRSASGWGTLDNRDSVEDDINDFEVQGFRASLKWDINENWSATGMYMEQSSDAGSYGYFDPFVGDLETVIFNDEFYDVDYDVTSLVIEGDLGFAQLVSATAYYNSESRLSRDTTVYQKSYAAFYCISYAGDPSYFPYYYSDPTGGVLFQTGQYCNSPTIEGDFTSAGDETQIADRFAQEIRLSSSGERIDWIVGAFYEESTYGYEEFFGYPTANENGRGDPLGLYQQTVSLNYNQFATGSTFPNAFVPFYARQVSDFEQIAAFGEVTWHATETIDLTLGGRYFERESFVSYTQETPLGNPDLDNIGDVGQEDSELAPKVAISYSPTDDHMFYALRSVGFRPGGANRQRGVPALPREYLPDEMVNWEVGYKGTLVDGRMNFQATAFVMDWTDFQFSLLDPASAPCPGGPGESIDGVCGQPFQVNVANAGDASIEGVSLYLDWAITDSLSIGANGQFLNAETTTNLDTDSDGVTDIPEGAQLPFTADFNGAAWANYEFPVPSLSATAFALVQYSYLGDRVNSIEPVEVDPANAFPQFTLEGYGIADLSIGLRGDTWEVNAFVNNFTDERANFGNYSLGGWSQYNLTEGRPHVANQYVNRPREFGVRFLKRWNGF